MGLVTSHMRGAIYIPIGASIRSGKKEKEKCDCLTPCFEKVLPVAPVGLHRVSCIHDVPFCIDRDPPQRASVPAEQHVDGGGGKKETVSNEFYFERKFAKSIATVKKRRSTRTGNLFLAPALTLRRAVLRL